MPAPATVDELLEIVVKSGVTEESRLKAYTRKLAEQGGVPTDPSKLAGQLVRDGLLTYFQAEQLLQGKWKRFNIGKYKVLERIGAGGMGQVFLCEHKFMRRRVAVKVLPTAKADDPASLERFYREAKAIAAVDHPNIVRAFDIDQDDNLHFLVMEYVDGANLQDIVKKAGPLDVLRACHYIYGSAVGLQHAHEVGLVHRDIKPGNILVNRSGVVKILDMGLARFFNDEDDVLTKKYDENVLGTADYLAPEQALESHSVDIRADIYSLGATFYYVLTGSAPFPEGSVPQKLIWHQTRQPRPVKSLRPDVPDELVAIVEKMMAKDMTQRYQTPAEVIAALAGWVTTPIPPPTDRELPQLSPAALGVGGQSPRSQVVSTPSFTTQTQMPNPLASFGGPGPPTAVGPWPGGPDRGPMTQPLTPGYPTMAPYQAGLAAHPAAVPSNGAMWEGIEAETQDTSDTERPALVTAHAATPGKGPGSQRGRRRKGMPGWVWMLGGFGLVIASAAVLAFFILGPKPKPRPTPGGDGGGTQTVQMPARTLHVSTKGGELHYPNLRLALQNARPGDVIHIEEERLLEPCLKLGPNFKDVTIDSNLPGLKHATIQFARDSTGSACMFELSQAEGMKIRNVILECKEHQVEAGVVLAGHCPGAALEHVTFRGMRHCSVRLQDVTGTKERPVVLDHLHAVIESKAVAGVAVETSPAQMSRDIILRQSRFEGLTPIHWKPPTEKTANPPLKPNDPRLVPPPADGAAVRFDGPASDVEVIFNRVFNVQKGIAFGPLPDKGVDQVLIRNNTFHSLKVGIFFDFPAIDVKGKYDVTVELNYFARTEALAKHAGVNGSLPLNFNHNVRETKNNNSREGNVSLGSVPVAGDFEMQKPAPNSPDANFLRYHPYQSPGKSLVRPGFHAE